MSALQNDSSGQIIFGNTTPAEPYMKQFPFIYSTQRCHCVLLLLKTQKNFMFRLTDE